jgi:hypothetical protein
VAEGLLRLIKLATAEDSAASNEVVRDLNTKRYELCDFSEFKVRMAAMMVLPPPRSSEVP